MRDGSRLHIRRLKRGSSLLVAAFLVGSAGAQPKQWQTYRGDSGPGLGKRVALISGDEEYRSEESLSQLGKILALRHGFTCVALYAQDPDAPGVINPNVSNHIPGMAALRETDVLIIATRFRALPDDQMREIESYLTSGRPVIGLRTATHAFRFPQESAWAHWSFDYKGQLTAWRGGFGMAILGATWVAHHGWHQRESTRGLLGTAHPTTRGVADGAIWSPTDVYTVDLPLPTGSVSVAYGQVLEGMSPDATPIGPGPYEYTPRFAQDDAAFDKNYPMMPIAWTKPYKVPGGRPGKAFATTLGASVDLLNEATRRLLAQAVYWALDLPIPEGGCEVGLVGSYQPTMFGFHREPGYWESRNLKVSDFDLQKTEDPSAIAP